MEHSALSLVPPQRRAPSGSATRTFALDRDTLRERRVVFPDEESLAGDAYRMLRTQLLQRVRQRGSRVIGIASPADGDGKTLTAVNLALALAAEPNQTILLVDMDLRRPNVAKLLDIPESRGVESILRGEIGVDEALWRPEGRDRLAVLPAAPLRGSSSEILADERTRAFLLEIRTRYTDRLVILDLPPILLTDDVLTLAPLLDGILLVIAEQRTRREDLQRAQALLVDVPQLGTVLNRATRSERRAY
ncbi:MAG: CpsD/CapB family tyrosine-protein kinase [Pseudomonadota bacterium]